MGYVNICGVVYWPTRSIFKVKIKMAAVAAKAGKYTTFFG